jgi:hypothetical protein
MEKERKKMKKFVYLVIFIFLNSIIFAQQNEYAQIISQGVAYLGKSPPSSFPQNFLRTGWHYTTGNLSINLLADRGGRLVDEVTFIYSYSSMEQARSVLRGFNNFLKNNWRKEGSDFQSDYYTKNGVEVKITMEEYLLRNRWDRIFISFHRISQ